MIDEKKENPKDICLTTDHKPLCVAYLSKPENSQYKWKHNFQYMINDFINIHDMIDIYDAMQHESKLFLL